MQITFTDSKNTFTWDFSAEDERLLEALRLRLVDDKSVPRFDSIGQMVTVHTIESLIADQIKIEIRDTLQVQFDASVKARLDSVARPQKTVPAKQAARKIGK